MKNSAWLCLAGWIVLGSISCGGGADTPPEKCEALISVLCSRVATCSNGEVTKAECTEGVKAELPCAKADRVGQSYSACIKDIQALSCPNVLAGNLPANCDEVILVEQ